MTNWAKAKNPRWWTFQAQRCVSIPMFWWRFVNTHPFPDGLECVDELVEYGKRHPIRGFNREVIRAYIFSGLHELYRCTSFVETGTENGDTTAFARRAFKTPVFSSELNNTSYLVSRMYLAWARQTRIAHLNSPEFLQEICDPATLGDNPMFYLDAHWNEYMPLPDELATIGDRCPRAVVLIDDFEVPWEPRFLYDGYPGVRINVDTVRKFLAKRQGEFSIYLPAYGPDVDPGGKGIGYAIVILGQQEVLPLERFPYNLLAPVPGDKQIVGASRTQEPGHIPNSAQT